MQWERVLWSGVFCLYLRGLRVWQAKLYANVADLSVYICTVFESICKAILWVDICPCSTMKCADKALRLTCITAVYLR
jgi:hypothetical protein